MMLRKKTKENPIKSCLIWLLAVVALMAACFLFCTVIFQLNQAAVAAHSNVLFTSFFG